MSPAQGLSLGSAPRVTMELILANIAAEYSTTADKAFDGCPLMPSMSLLTLHVLVLKNGFTVVGKSACASPENFNAETGRKVARDDAIEQCWLLMGYALREQLHQSAHRSVLP